MSSATSRDTATVGAIAAETGAATSRNTLGILPFRVASSDPTVSALGFALADMLVTDLSRSARITVVERARLGEVLRELDLVKSGRVDSASAPRIGALIRANRLVLGSLDTLPSKELRLAVRVASVASGVVEEAVDARAPLNDILAAEKAVAFRVFDALSVTLTPRERALIETRPTTNLDALLAYGRGVQAELAGDTRRAIDEFTRASTIDLSFQQAGQRATDVRSQARAASAPTLVPGVRSLEQPVTSAIDRLNRPLDLLTSLSRPLAGASDPAFPGTVVTVLITVRRP